MPRTQEQQVLKRENAKKIETAVNAALDAIKPALIETEGLPPKSSRGDVATATVDYIRKLKEELAESKSQVEVMQNTNLALHENLRLQHLQLLKVANAVLYGDITMAKGGSWEDFKYALQTGDFLTPVLCEAAEVDSNIMRQDIPKHKMQWDVAWDDYMPKDYTAKSVTGKPGVDLGISDGLFAWNCVDGTINRVSHFKKYSFDPENRPMNPTGRTGLRGRGTLDRWGPNHFAHILVSRNKGTALQIAVVESQSAPDSLSLPGGTVDAIAVVLESLRHRFAEVAVESRISPANLNCLWENGTVVFRGYVDDPRNTDNAWMEAVVTNFHDSEGLLADVEPRSGDDAANVRWVAVNDARLKGGHKFIVDFVMSEIYGL